MQPASPSVDVPTQGVEHSRSAHVVVSPSGASLYRRPLTHGGGGKRGRVIGWTAASARRHTRWLQSIDGDLLDGSAFAVTLTVRDLPDGPEVWHDAIHTLLVGLSRAGVIRGHWVMENQKRGCPHLHLGVWFVNDTDEDTARSLIVDLWLRVAAEWRPLARSQDVHELAHGGWSKYVAKHSSRSVNHAQRTGLPGRYVWNAETREWVKVSEWESSGRLWGKFGDWDQFRSELEFMLDAHTWVALRRLLRSWRTADAARALIVARRAAESADSLRGREVAIHHLRLAKGRVAAMKGSPRRRRSGAMRRRLAGASWSGDIERWGDTPVTREWQHRYELLRDATAGVGVRKPPGRGFAQVQGMREWVPRDVMLALIEHAVNETPGGWVLFGKDLVQDAA